MRPFDSEGHTCSLCSRSDGALFAHNGGITDQQDHSSQERNVKYTDLTMSDENPSKNRGSDASVGIRPQEGDDQSNGKQLVRANSEESLYMRSFVQPDPRITL